MAAPSFGCSLGKQMMRLSGPNEQLAHLCAKPHEHRPTQEARKTIIDANDWTTRPAPISVGLLAVQILNSSPVAALPQPRMGGGCTCCVSCVRQCCVLPFACTRLRHPRHGCRTEALSPTLKSQIRCASMLSRAHDLIFALETQTSLSE